MVRKGLRLLGTARARRRAENAWLRGAATEACASLDRQVLRNVTEDAERIGSKDRPDIMITGVRTYHFTFSRDRVEGLRLKVPRHFVLYRQRTDGEIEIRRILHDSRDLERHLPESYGP